MLVTDGLEGAVEDAAVTVFRRRLAKQPTADSVTARRPHRFQVCGHKDLPRWDAGAWVATRDAYGEALAALGRRRGDVVALDGEVSSATCPGPFARAHPDRYFEMSLAERQMIAAAAGMQTCGWVPFASVFFPRAYHFVRLAAMSRANLRLVGSCADFADGQDGTSQAALDDFASLRAVPGSIVLHPSDANQVPPLVAQMADHPGISYLRTLRPKTVVRTHPGEDIRIGGSRLVRGSDEDDVTVVACGITVGEAVEAAGQLERDGVRVRVIDCYSIKPIDTAALRSAARQTAVMVTVEDHWPEGGLGEAVLSALADQPHRPPVLRLAVRDVPVSGQPAERLHAAGIDAAAIVGAVRTHLASTRADAAPGGKVPGETAADGVLVRLEPMEPESALSSRPGKRGKRRPAYGWLSLTSTERNVAGIIAEGATNRQAAARLYLSRHTIDFHLRQIFRKLGISSRVELTRLVVQHSSAAHGQPSPRALSDHSAVGIAGLPTGNRH